MAIFNIWVILGIATIILLFVYWGKKQNAVWGGFTLGIIVGLMIAIIFLVIGKGFNWLTIWKGAVSGAILGFVAELLGKGSDFIKNRNISKKAVKK